MIVGKGVASYFLGYLDELPPGGTHAPSGQHSLDRNTYQDGLQAPGLVTLWRGRRYVGGGLNFQLHGMIHPLIKRAPQKTHTPQYGARMRFREFVCKMM